jgi:GDP-L-fucose synthase
MVTGASGLVGTGLIDALSSDKNEVLALSSKDLDLRVQSQVESVFQTFRPNLVYHLAADVFGLGGNSKYRSDILTNNVRINTNVIEAAAKHGVSKVVAMGSGCVYPDFENREPLTEDQIWSGPPHPSEAPYAHSKRLMLSHLEAAREQYNMDFAFVISGNLFGPGDNFNVEDGHVIPSLVAKFHAARQSGTAVRPWGTGRAIRDFTYSEDMASALLLIADRISGPVNAGSGHRHAISEIVGILSEFTGVQVEWDPSMPDGQLARFYDLSKLFGAGFQPKTDLKSGIAQTLGWYTENFPRVRR